MKVLFITNIPVPYRIDFYNELGKHIDLTVIFEAKGAEGIRFNWNIEEIKNFKSIFLSEGNINEKKVDWKIFKYINKHEYDYIVVTSYSYFTEMMALIYMKLRRIPYFMETDGGLIRKENSFKRLYKKFLISHAKGYFSPSKGSDDYLVYYGANRNCVYRYPFTSLKESEILNSIPSEDEIFYIKEELKIKEEKVILSVGQFIYRKGYDILLKACKDLDENIGVYIIGGKATEEYKQLINTLGLKNINFLEFEKKEVLYKYYKAADLFILPTREDIWGLVINEAMAHGLPVITTKKCVAGMELVIKGVNGEIVEVEDFTEMRLAIENILYSKEIKELQKSSLSIIKKYTIEEMAKAHLKIFMKDKSV